MIFYYLSDFYLNFEKYKKKEIVNILTDTKINVLKKVFKDIHF